MYALHIILGTTVFLLLVAFLASPFLIARDAQTRFGYAFFGDDIRYVWVVAGASLWIGHFWIKLAEKYHGEYTEKYAWGLIAFGVAGFAYVIYKNIMGTNLTYGLASSLVLIPAMMVLSGAVVPALLMLGFIGAATSSSPVRKERFDNGSDTFYPPGTPVPLGSIGQLMGEEQKKHG